jgi:hypothetical protein
MFHSSVPRFRPGFETLESRDTPSAALLSETFEEVKPPALPSGWQSWSSTDDGYISSKLASADGSPALASLGSRATQSRFWSSAAQPADAGVSVRYDSVGPAPIQVLARGQNLGTATPSYLAATVTPGARQVSLVEVQNGVARTVAKLATANPVYGVWLNVTLQPLGNRASVEIQRPDTKQYLNPQGQWQTAEVAALQGGVTAQSAAGLVGAGREAGGQGMTFLDDILVTPPPDTSVHESFDQLAAGSLPPNWKGWTSDGSAGFVVSPLRDVSAPNGLVANGSSVTAARAWLGDSQPADVQASASFFADSLIPGSVFARGSNLDTATPTYYALTATRGLGVRLVKVVNGAETTLAAVKSTAYTSGVWVRLSLTVSGDELRAVVFRPDTGQWLTPDGAWVGSPQPALSATDAGVTGGGSVGFARSRLAAGPVGFDDLEILPGAAIAGPQVTVTASQTGASVSNDVTFHATADPAGAARRVEFRVDGQLQAAFASAPADWTLDTTLLTNGTHQLDVRAVDQAGNVGDTTLSFTVANAAPLPMPTRPTLATHYDHIQFAALAYAGNPMGPFEQQKLEDSVDLLIPNPQYMQRVNQFAPDTPQLIYSNLSNLYQGLLTDWLHYADQNGDSRELAFYHVSQATPFTGGSPSSQPVNWFWNATRGAADGSGTQANLTSASQGGQGFGVAFGAAGQAVNVGYPDKFREVNFTIDRAAAPGWHAVYEYPTAVGPDGTPTAWKQLAPIQDTTGGLGQSGQVIFDPPADWVTARLGGSADWLFYVRVRTTTGTAAQAPDARTILGRDYVGAGGRSQGVIPAFDYAADADHDGYLSDAEYAKRAKDMDARFVYESRLFYPFYGQMRFVTNPSSSAVRQWAADYHARLLRQNPLADGVFLDNSGGRLPFAGTPVVEPVATYSQDSANLVAAVWRTVGPKLVVTNTSGGRTDADPIAKNSVGALEEFAIRPTEATWSAVNDLSNLVRERLGADSPSPYLILDTYSGMLAMNSPRVQNGALAYYYLLADPKRTMIMFFGGQAPSAPWSQTWIQSAQVDIGQPAGSMFVFASGQDPENTALQYQVFGRQYGRALVLYKPLSYTLGRGTGTLDDATATTQKLDGNYRVLNPDGTLGPVVNQISLRNGEGAVLWKVG